MKENMKNGAKAMLEKKAHSQLTFRMELKKKPLVPIIPSTLKKPIRS